MRPEDGSPPSHPTDPGRRGTLLTVEHTWRRGEERGGVRIVEKPVATAALLRADHRHAERGLTDAGRHVATTHSVTTVPSCKGHAGVLNDGHPGRRA
jgi:hypothetical protein